MQNKMIESLARCSRVEDLTLKKIAYDLVVNKTYERDDLMMLEIVDFLRDYYEVKALNPDQPRDANGRWTSGGTGEGAVSDVSPKTDGSFDVAVTAQEHISAKCLGSINRVFPGQFLNMDIADIQKLAKSGDRAAQSACKLLFSNEYKK
jgi:hypothetical protein